MRQDPTTPTMRPVDVYLGFEIFAEDTGFVAISQDWAADHPEVLQAPDLPTLRKLIWRWWHSLQD